MLIIFGSVPLLQNHVTHEVHEPTLCTQIVFRLDTGSETTGALVEQCNGKLQTLTDKCAPLQSKTITFKSRTPWYNNFNKGLCREKRERRRCERRGRGDVRELLLCWLLIGRL